MEHSWTFGQKLASGLAAKSVLTLLLSVVAVIALRVVTAAKDRVITNNASNVARAYRLEGTAFERMGTVRAFLLTGDPVHKERVAQLRQDFFD